MKKEYRSYAKINIGLNIGELLPNNKHELESIIYPINLFDKIILEKSDSFKIESNKEIKDNVLYKVLDLFIRDYNIPKTKITLEKNIPMASGLGGGSSNASCLINALNNFYNLKIGDRKLLKISKMFGSDTVFSLYNKPAYVYYDGTKIKFLDKKIEKNILIIYFDFKVLTKDMFLKTLKKKITKIDYKLFLSSPLEYIKKSKNDFLNIMINENKEFKETYGSIIKISENIKMTGSGPSLYLINYKSEELSEIKDVLKKYKFAKLISTTI